MFFCFVISINLSIKSEFKKISIRIWLPDFAHSDPVIRIVTLKNLNTHTTILQKCVKPLLKPAALMFPQQKKPFAPILQNFLKLGQIRRLIVSVGAEPDPQRSSLY